MLIFNCLDKKRFVLIKVVFEIYFRSVHLTFSARDRADVFSRFDSQHIIYSSYSKTHFAIIHAYNFQFEIWRKVYISIKTRQKKQWQKILTSFQTCFHKLVEAEFWLFRKSIYRRWHGLSGILTKSKYLLRINQHAIKSMGFH